MPRLRRLLVANRGEIAVRIARTARAMGLATVGVATDADADAPYVRAFDTVVPLGDDRAGSPYLDAARLVAAATATGCDAVHPGYGFLSENPAFAEAVLAAGLAWVGPPPAAMRTLGDKAEARRVAQRLGVPVVPGHDADGARDALVEAAGHIGYPLLVKAAAGGGGRGMRVVRDAASLEATLEAAAREADAAFGSGRLVLERYLQPARHVEVQLFADAHGAVIHLGERDCSVQRRHQKLIEEAPAPGVTPALRRAMGAAAVTLARHAGYVGAGTAEFLLAADGGFHFIETNARLQVEHGVTERLLGVDLVGWQLRIAQGEPLPWSQEEALARVEAGGHAIEARLCAEDPLRDDLPQAGTVWRWRTPAGARSHDTPAGERSHDTPADVRSDDTPGGLRVDHALADGARVSDRHDSMLAKLIAHAPAGDASPRATACADLAHALDETLCLGVATNRALLAHVLRHPAFVAGHLSTAFLAEHVADRSTLRPPADAASRLEALAAWSMARLPRTTLPAAWAGWSLPALRTLSVRVEGDGHPDRGDLDRHWTAEAHEGDAVTLRRGDVAHRLSAWRVDGPHRVAAEVDGHRLRAEHAADGDRWAWQDGAVTLALVDTRLHGRAAEGHVADGVLRAPLHGRVVRVAVEAGAAVAAGEVLVVVEAMKMEHAVAAPRAGTVRAVHVRPGDQVATRQALVELG